MSAPIMVSIMSCRRASSAVEFALTVPILLLLVFGIFAVGMYCAVLNGLEQLAAGAARQTISGITDAERTQLANSYLTTSTGNYPYLQQSALTTTVANGAGTRTTTVMLSYDTSKSPVFLLIARLVPIAPRMLTRTAVVPQGGQ